MEHTTATPTDRLSLRIDSLLERLTFLQSNNAELLRQLHEERQAHAALQQRSSQALNLVEGLLQQLPPSNSSNTSQAQE